MNNTTYIANIPLFVSVEVTSPNPTPEELYEAVVQQVGRNFEQVGYDANDLDFDKTEITEE